MDGQRDGQTDGVQHLTRFPREGRIIAATDARCCSAHNATREMPSAL